MASIPEDKIAEVRVAADIVQVIGRVVNLKRAGRSYQGLCPFHEERSPSFNVSPDRQMYYCFGCQAGGDVFRFVMDYEGRSFPEAVRRLAEEVGIPLPDSFAPEDPRAAARKRARLGILEANGRAAQLYAAWLARSEPGQAHLQERGIEAGIATEFGLGYAPLRNDLPGRLVQAGVEPRILQDAGLVTSGARGLQDRFQGRLMVPIRTPDGDVVAFGARRVEGDHPAKYLNSPETLAYTKSDVLFGLDLARQHIRRQDAAIVVEGYFDVIALHQAGIRNAVATCGTALTPGHVKLLGRHARDVYLVFDGDAAGLKAAARAYEVLAPARNLVARVVLLPQGDDPDTYVRTQGADAFRALLDQAKPVVEHLIDHALADVGLRVEERVRAVGEVAPILRMVRDPVERRLYAEMAADRLRLDLKTVAAQLRESATPAGPPEPPPPPGSVPAASAPRPVADLPPPPGDEEAVCLLTLGHPDLLGRVEAHLDVFTHPGVRSLLDELVVSHKELGQVDLAAALSRVEDPRLAARWRAHLANTDRQEQTIDVVQATRVLDQYLRRLQLSALDQQEAALRRRHAADGVDPLTAARELRDFKERRRRLSRPAAQD